MNTELIERKLRDLREEINGTWATLYQKIGAGQRITGDVIPKTYTVANLPDSSFAKVPGSAVDNSDVGTLTWSNPTYVTFADQNSSFAGTAGAGGIGTHTTHYLKLTNFGFSIPTGETILGIVVRVKRLGLVNNGTTEYVRDSTIKLVKADGTLGSENKADTATNWLATLTFHTWGSSTDLWSETWSPTDINDSDFGVVISCTVKSGPDGNSAGIDLAEIIVYHSNTINRVTPGQIAYVSNARKNGEASGAGTGVLAFRDTNAWKSCDTSSTVAS